MQMPRHAFFGFVLFLVLMIMCCSAYNNDRPIYKWSPVWFSRYFRNEQKYKRGPPAAYAEVHEVPEECVPENQRCGYWGLEMPCCNLYHCVMDHCTSEENLFEYN